MIEVANTRGVFVCYCLESLNIDIALNRREKINLQSYQTLIQIKFILVKQNQFTLPCKDNNVLIPNIGIRFVH